MLGNGGIRSLAGGKPGHPGSRRPVALPPPSMREAIPKDVSGRTSYYPARLEFHHVPQLIRGRFNGRRCGPPQGFAPASSWSWQDRRVSGADMQTGSPCSDSLSLRLRLFALASLACTDSQAHSSIGTASGFNALRHLVGTRFQDLFHSPPGVLFTFPSRYLFAIGSRTVFSLAGRSPRLRTGFHVSRLTLSRRTRFRSGYGAFTPYGAPFQALPLRKPALMSHSGSSAFARHYSRNRSLFLLLRVLRCFGSPGCLPAVMCWLQGDMHVACRVPPFGNPGIEAYVQLPRAYRRLSRPSSPSGSKASAARLISFLSPQRDGSAVVWLSFRILRSILLLHWRAGSLLPYVMNMLVSTGRSYNDESARFYFRKNYGIQFSRLPRRTSPAPGDCSPETGRDGHRLSTDILSLSCFKRFRTEPSFSVERR